jgi:hypothetical protein
MYDQSSRTERGIQPQSNANTEPKRLVKLDETVDGTTSRQDIIARSVQGCKSHQVGKRNRFGPLSHQPIDKEHKKSKTP